MATGLNTGRIRIQRYYFQAIQKPNLVGYPKSFCRFTLRFLQIQGSVVALNSNRV